MMKKLRILSLALAGALCFSVLAGCGSSNGGTANTPTGGNTETPAGGSAEPSGGASGAIKIGGIGPLTGGAATYGVATKQGAEIAVAEINALGGVQLSLDFQDDEGDFEKALNAYNKLKDDHHAALRGRVQ